MLSNSFGMSRKRPLGTSDQENVWPSLLGIDVWVENKCISFHLNSFCSIRNDFGVAVKQPRLALESVTNAHNLFNTNENIRKYKFHSELCPSQGIG